MALWKVDFCFMLVTFVLFGEIYSMFFTFIFFPLNGEKASWGYIFSFM